MDWAINKFKTRKESEQWSQRTTEEETIIALQAQVNTLMSQKKPNPTGRPNASGKKDFKQENNKRGKGKGRPRMDIQPKWMSVPPKNGEKHHSKTVEGKDYYWCPNHNRWTRHRPSECKGIGFKAPIASSQILDKKWRQPTLWNWRLNGYVFRAVSQSSVPPCQWPPIRVSFHPNIVHQHNGVLKNT